MPEAEEYGYSGPGGEYSLVMPFVVCASQGGPYEDTALAAGYQCGRLAARLEFARPLHVHEYVYTDLVPQIDLVAMRFGYTIRHVPWEAQPGKWTFVELIRQDSAVPDTA